MLAGSSSCHLGSADGTYVYPHPQARGFCHTLFRHVISGLLLGLGLKVQRAWGQGNSLSPVYSLLQGEALDIYQILEKTSSSLEKDNNVRLRIKNQ